MKKNRHASQGAVKVQAANLKGTPFQNVKFSFVNLSPELAADWLKRNQKNRRVKEKTIEAYMMDMRNGAWLTTHQGIAFDATGNLVDGQHRLLGIVQSKKTILTLVSTGWPVSMDSKRKTMDAVDRGVNRSLADQLHLQHNISPRDAARVVKICNGIAAASMGSSRIRKSTTDSILAVLGFYKSEIRWISENPIQQHGLKQATVAACMVMARALWPEKTADFLNRLATGENLNRENPILSLRNWLMASGSREDVSLVRQTVFHHLCAFVDGKTCASLVTHSNAAFLRVLKLSKVRTDKICFIYNQIVPEFLGEKKTEETDSKKFNPLGPEAVKLAASLGTVFSSTDLMARVDENAGQWLLVWRNHGWIEPSGIGQFRKTEKFGKVVAP